MKKVRLIVVGFFCFLGFLAGSAVVWFASAREAGNVAVVRIEGGIFDSEPTVRQLDEMSEDDGIKAVVLRIDSPGGTVSAAQEIHDAVKSLREKKKVVVSMGTVAASGGYYVALPADRILANPGTITGSIGVRMELMNAEELVRWIRLKPETLKSGALKDIGSPFRTMTAEERTLLESILKEMHRQFKAALAEARGLSPEEVDRLADGRIFTGTEALANRLIDGLGSLKEAIRVAGELAGIPEPEPIYLPHPKGRLWDYLVQTAVRRTVEVIFERQWRASYD